ncbi:MAG: Flp pilus assembly protein CpaB [Jatrophihabitantaceae bacterium]
MSRSLAELLARLNRWPRRLAALACLLLAALSALSARNEGRSGDRRPVTGTRVVVAARDLGVGSTLDGHDLLTVAWPPELVPPGASGQTAQLVGRRLASPIRKREAVTTTRLVGADLTAGLPPGEVATPISTDAGFATLIHAGDHVDVLAAPPDEPTSTASPGKSGAASAILVAAAVTVLAVLPSTDAVGGSQSAQLLVATTRGTALRIAALRGRQVLAVAAGPP